MKKALAMALSSILLVSVFAACSSRGASSAAQQTPESAVAADGVFKVGMVTEGGSIDDKSYNQACWEGLELAKETLGVEIKYLKPTGYTEADYMKEIVNLYDSGHRAIVTPGWAFSTAVHKAQFQYPDCYFILLDGVPQAEDADEPEIAENAVGVDFAGQEAGFIAGFASAMQVKEGEAGGLFGVPNPASELFMWGFEDGVLYANENYGTNVVVKPENFVWVGSWEDVSGAQQLAAQLFDQGVNILFCSAGTSGLGGINEAKARAEQGQQVWTVGCDSDQYEEGIISNGSSVMLTSAMKRIDLVGCELIGRAMDGTFPGGEFLMYTVKENSMGLPDVNPNLDEDVQQICDEVYAMMQSGEVVVTTVEPDMSKYA